MIILGIIISLILLALFFYLSISVIVFIGYLFNIDNLREEYQESKNIRHCATVGFFVSSIIFSLAGFSIFISALLLPWVLLSFLGK